MDYWEKRLLTKSVAYLQANLTVTSELLKTLKHARVLTEEEVSTIQVTGTDGPISTLYSVK